jgi:hypothetical protein
MLSRPHRPMHRLPGRLTMDCMRVHGPRLVFGDPAVVTSVLHRTLLNIMAGGHDVEAPIQLTGAIQRPMRKRVMTTMIATCIRPCRATA